MRIDEYLTLVGKFEDELMAVDKKRHIVTEGEHELEVYIDGQVVTGDYNMLGKLVWEILSVNKELDREDLLAFLRGDRDAG